MINIQECYFEWLTMQVFRFTYERDQFIDLLHLLHSIEFTYTIPKDGNRYDDGLELKKTFCYETGTHISYLELLGTKCSVLEMMVALADRCERNTMANPEYGNRTWLWFQTMLENLHLLTQHGSNFNENYSVERIETFLNHEYSYNGDGSLFYVRNPSFNMQQAELWLQLSWYLSENFS